MLHVTRLWAAHWTSIELHVLSHRRTWHSGPLIVNCSVGLWASPGVQGTRGGQSFSRDFLETSFRRMWLMKWAVFLSGERQNVNNMREPSVPHDWGSMSTLDMSYVMPKNLWVIMSVSRTHPMKANSRTDRNAACALKDCHRNVWERLWALESTRIYKIALKMVSGGASEHQRAHRAIRFLQRGSRNVLPVYGGRPIATGPQFNPIGWQSHLWYKERLSILFPHVPFFKLYLSVITGLRNMFIFADCQFCS